MRIAKSVFIGKPANLFPVLFPPSLCKKDSKDDAASLSLNDLEESEFRRILGF